MVRIFNFFDIVWVFFMEQKITHENCRVFFFISLSFLRDFDNPYLQRFLSQEKKSRTYLTSKAY